MSLKIVLVGCGKIADGHIEEIQKMPGKARVVAVCDRELLMAEQVAVRYGIPQHYNSYARMLELEKPDVVHITTPPQSHLALAVQAVDAGCHVYVEKPLTLNYTDSQKLVKHAEAAKRKLTIGYSYNFDPLAIRMRELIAKGVSGDPVHVETFFGYDLSGPFGQALMSDSSHWVHQLPGKLFQNNIDHLLIRLAEFFPNELPTVHAFAAVRREQRFRDTRDEMPDELRVVIEGARLSAYATFSSHIRPVANFLRVHGSENTIHVDFAGRTVTMDSKPKLPGALGRLLPAFEQSLQYFREGRTNIKRFLNYDFHYFSGLHRLISLYYDSIINDTEVPISARNILWVSAVMDEIFREIGEAAERPSGSVNEFIRQNRPEAVLIR